MLHRSCVLVLATLASAGAGAELRQGACMEGWTDGSAVGLGCLLADLEAWGDVETTGETVCRHHGEGGRLVEVLDGDQMSFLQEMLGQMEADNQDMFPDGPSWIWYWLGLNDRQEEGVWVWPDSGEASYTYWDQDYDEPLPDPDHEYNCAVMQSAQFRLLWQTYDCDDGYDMVPVCQLP